MDSNMFSSSIPLTLTGLTDLLILNLSSNSLSGPLPIDIGKWKVLTSMDLSNNQFSGDIPNGVADLKDLVHFSLSNNRITGFIPGSFGELWSLEFLDLSRNNLFGEIPKSLENLRYLKLFNVSFNRLYGEIPKGGSFVNYSIESFKGNEALCGAPQLHVPACKTKPLKNSKAKAKLIIYVALPIASTILVMALIIITLRRRKRKEKLTTRGDLLPSETWRRISYHELHQATNGFSESNLLDTSLLSTTGRERSAANNCALSILQVGLECSVELPDERLDMKEIVTKLKKIKAKLMKDTGRLRQRGRCQFY
ncbi:hypothetical protein V6N11_043061 [Hibiscus sabdariffa]|uniref:Uncharacterized protein n=1 Tax=Hibiscus sabdariffa TaxID=183260 RepID=A0ABR2QY85_9ROSI